MVHIRRKRQEKDILKLSLRIGCASVTECHRDDVFTKLLGPEVVFEGVSWCVVRNQLILQEAIREEVLEEMNTHNNIICIHLSFISFHNRCYVVFEGVVQLDSGECVVHPRSKLTVPILELRRKDRAVKSVNTPDKCVSMQAGVNGFRELNDGVNWSPVK